MIYEFNEIPIKILARFIVVIHKTILKVYRTTKDQEKKSNFKKWEREIKREELVSLISRPILWIELSRLRGIDEA